MAAEGDNFVRNFRGEFVPIVRFTYTGADGEVIPDEATHILVQARVVERGAFRLHPNIVEVICHGDVEEIEDYAFDECPSLKRVIMPGVKVIEEAAFYKCDALEHVACDKLERVGRCAFFCCRSLRNINLPSVRIVEGEAFNRCRALKNVKFCSKLVEIWDFAFLLCESLEQITIPLKDGLFYDDNIFAGCDNLNHVDLIEGELHETIAALHLEEWRNDMNQEIDSINQILPSSSAGTCVVDEFDYYHEDESDPGEKAQVLRRWIGSVLRKIIDYQAEHQSLLEEGVAATLELVLPNDIVMNNVLPFVELPPYTTFEAGDEEDEYSDDEEQSSENSLGDDEEE